MKLLRRKDYPDGKFTLAFLGYDDEDRASAIELTYNFSLEPGPMLYDPDEVIAFIHDPDGYMIELIARQ